MDWFPATATASSPSTVSPSRRYPASYLQPSSTTSLPLTKENLCRVAHTSPEDYEPSISMLARYYNDLPLPPLPRSARRERKISSATSSIRSDTVLASPRLSPFPYHNDSLFLPTAEQQQHQCHTIGYRPSLSHIQQKRRSSATEPQRPVSPLATAAPRRQASAPPLDRATRRQWHHSENAPQLAKMAWPNVVRHWLSKVFHVSKHKKRSSMAHGDYSPGHGLGNDAPVWYTQFAANPPPPSHLPIAVA